MGNCMDIMRISTVDPKVDFMYSGETKQQSDLPDRFILI